ncbi:MAG TPA: DNA polymerase domain-containing protein [Nitrososphaeraceae archaeon]
MEETISDNLEPEEDKDNYFNKRREKLLDYYKRVNFKVVEEEFDEEREDVNEDGEKEDDEGRVRYIDGLVIRPRSGEYKDVYVFDVASLYPSEVVEQNLSFAL